MPKPHSRLVDTVRVSPGWKGSACWVPGSDTLVAIGMCALWAPRAPTLPHMPAQLGPSATAETSLTCPSVRSAPQDWPALGVSEGRGAVSLPARPAPG